MSRPLRPRRRSVSSSRPARDLLSAARGRSTADPRIALDHRGTNSAAARHPVPRRRAAHPPLDVLFRHGLRGRRHRPDRRRHRATAHLLLQGGPFLDAGAGHRRAHGVQLPLDHQADLRPRLRFRAVVRLSPQELSHSRKPGHDWRLSSRCAYGGVESAIVRAAADRLRNGDREHAVRRALGRERPALRHQRSVREPAVAMVPHRGDELVADRRPADTEIVTGRRPAWRGADRGDRAADDRVRHMVSGPGGETAGRPSRTQARGTQPARRLSHPLALDRRAVSLSLFV